MCNPGLYHLPERILGLLDRKTLLKCREVSQTWKQFIDDPNQKWRREWNRKLESTLEAEIYLKRENGKLENLYEAWPHSKEVCEYFQNDGPLPQMIVFTQSLVQIESRVNSRLIHGGLEGLFLYGGYRNSAISSFWYNPISLAANCTKFFKVLLSCPKIPMGKVSQ